MSKPTGKTYPISTIDQMAEIPPERVEAFLEELPEILRILRHVKADVRASQGGNLLARLFPFVSVRTHVSWVDKGKYKGKVTYPDGTVYETEDWRNETTSP